MHVDARTLENGSLIEGDICIIGAGAAGISMALEWANTPYKVILLEGGGFSVEAKIQDLYKGKSIGQRYYAMESARLHYFGGTTGHWAGFCSLMDEIDFRQRDWVPHSGWPIGLEDINPYYLKARKILEIDSGSFDLKDWTSNDADLQPLPMDKAIVWSKVWRFSPPTRFGKTYKDAIVQAKNIHLYTYANVVNLEANAEVSGIKEVHVKNLEGKQHTVRAKYFIMACCAIQNSRMLLASNRQAPRGLGNDHDLVGRFFMEHLEVTSAEFLMPSERQMKLYYQWVFNETQVRAELAISEKKQEELKMLNGTAAFNTKESLEGRPPNIDSFGDDAVGTVQMWLDMEKGRIRKRGFFESKSDYLCKDFEMFTRMEQAPNPASRITLSSERDALDVPRSVLDWKLTALDKQSIRKLYELIGAEAGKIGVGRVRMLEWLEEKNDLQWPATLGGGWHHMGTTRMANNPSQGVVDSNCKVHGLSNLFMAGSSCFPTSGAVSPTLTLVALTLRLSDHVKQIISNKINLGSLNQETAKKVSNRKGQD